jgi:hypothetical protein
MSPTFKGGAFIQQCFAVHQLSLSLKKMAPPDRILLACTACNLLHRLTVRAVVLRRPVVAEAAGGEAGGAKDAAEQLARCAESHPAALGVRAMDVVEEAAGLRCAECRRLYDLDVAAFETEQK